MREFIYGTDEQYKDLKDKLIANDGMCVVYNNCELPPGFSKDNGRIGFEKDGESFTLYIDKGLTCPKAGSYALLDQWLSSGTLRFLEFTDMKVFLRSLRVLY